jgi:hypothetical protein
MGRLFLTETDNSTIFAEQRKARTRVGGRFFLCGFNMGEGLTVARENARNCLTRVRALKVRGRSVWAYESKVAGSTLRFCLFVSSNRPTA